MPIRPFLAGQPFEPAHIDDMSQALSSVCDELGLVMQDDAATRAVAKVVVELAQRGLRGAELRAAVLAEFKHDD